MCRYTSRTSRVFKGKFTLPLQRITSHCHLLPIKQLFGYVKCFDDEPSFINERSFNHNPSFNPVTGDFERYMEILCIRKKDPGLGELGRIVHAHMVRIPFENISKLYYLRNTGERNIPPLARYLDGIEQYHFGGTCYANNYHLHQLLRFLGYDVRLCGASMEHPDVHLVNLVKIKGREFIVDAGYGAPFLVPLPRDLPEGYSISLGTDQYVIGPMDENGCTSVTLYRNGLPSHGYRMHPSPRRIEEFRHVIKDSFHPRATFMNCVLLVRFRTGYSQLLHNLTHLESRGRKVTRRQLENQDALIAVIEDTFGIPSAISRVALEGMTMSRSAWS